MRYTAAWILKGQKVQFGRWMECYVLSDRKIAFAVFSTTFGSDGKNSSPDASQYDRSQAKVRRASARPPISSTVTYTFAASSTQHSWKALMEFFAKRSLSSPYSIQNNIRCCIHSQGLLPHQRSCSGCTTNTNLSFRVNYRCSRRTWYKLSVILRATMNVVALIGAVVVTGSAHCVLHGILRDPATTGPRRIVTSPCGRLQAKSINEYDLWCGSLRDRHFCPSAKSSHRKQH
jgi:hypothetical protein